ncbi:MAG: hypothetical protein ABWK00_03530, partial [Desulfurococcaceae archaeon]
MERRKSKLRLCCSALLTLSIFLPVVSMAESAFIVDVVTLVEVFNAGRAALNPSDVGAGAYGYPANDTGQVVLGISVIVNGSRRGFTISWGEQPVLVVEGPLPNVPPNG